MLIQVKESGWTGLSSGWQGCSSGFSSSFTLRKSLGAALPSLRNPVHPSSFTWTNQKLYMTHGPGSVARDGFEIDKLVPAYHQCTEYSTLCGVQCIVYTTLGGVHCTVDRVIILSALYRRSLFHPIK